MYYYNYPFIYLKNSPSFLYMPLLMHPLRFYLIFIDPQESTQIYNVIMQIKIYLHQSNPYFNISL